MGALVGSAVLNTYLSRRGLDSSDLHGLNVKIMASSLQIPVFSITGKYVYTIVRVLDSRELKYYYLPTSCSPGYYPFGLNMALKSIIDRGCVIVVEGFSDALAVRKNGFPNVVSTQTSRISKVTQALLRCFTDSIVVLGDGDEAGEKFINQDIDFDNMIRLTTPKGTDPASFFSTQSDSAKHLLTQNSFEAYREE